MKITNVKRSDIPEKPGVFKLTCEQTGEYYLGSSVNLNRKFKELFLKDANKEVLKLLQEGKTFRFDYEVFDSPEEAREQLTSLLQKSANDSKLLNIWKPKSMKFFTNMDLKDIPKSPGVLIVTCNETGQKYVAHSKNLHNASLKAKNLLTNGKFENKEFQELYNKGYTFSIEYEITNTVEETKDRKLKYISEDTSGNFINKYITKDYKILSNVDISELPESFAVYKITAHPSGKFYIGATNNLRKRFYQHKKSLLNNNNKNINLQKLFNAGETFVLEYEVCNSTEEALEKEDNLIKENSNNELMLNISLSAYRWPSYQELKDRHPEFDRIKSNMDANNEIRNSKISNSLKKYYANLTEEEKKKLNKAKEEKSKIRETSKQYWDSLSKEEMIKYKRKISDDRWREVLARKKTKFAYYQNRRNLNDRAESGWTIVYGSSNYNGLIDETAYYIKIFNEVTNALLPIEEIKKNIEKFCKFTHEHKELKFFVLSFLVESFPNTKLRDKLYSMIVPSFKEANPNNCFFHEGWEQFLDNK